MEEILMSVYKHEQGSYRSYRVARSVNGKLRQKYFPRSEDGFAEAQKLDQAWAEEQAQAQMSFSGLKARWRKQPQAVSPTDRNTDGEQSTAV